MKEIVPPASIDIEVIEALAKKSADFDYMIMLLSRYGIHIQTLIGASTYQLPKRLTFPEALDRALIVRFNLDKTTIRDLQNQVENLESEIISLSKQIPKVKEIELADGTTMHIIGDE